MICYLSKNYKNSTNGGNKAKMDIEEIMASHGFRNVGLKQTTYSNAVISYLLTLFGVGKCFFSLHKGDTIVLQYPFKKYYSIVCKMAHLRGCKVITLIHDLGSFRRKKLTIPQEIKKLNQSEAIIVHSESMKNWLLEHGIQSHLEVLEIFDYLSESHPLKNEQLVKPFRVVFTGGLSTKQNEFLYRQAEIAKSYELVLYGGGLDADKMKGQFDYKGFVQSDELISTVEANFGLVWYGPSLEGGHGPLGEYLQYNAPHKMSLYIRCGLPIIIWKKAALADFVNQHKIGICVDSLEELEDIFAKLSVEEYLKMKENITAIARQLSEGFHAYQAISRSAKYLDSHQ